MFLCKSRGEKLRFWNWLLQMKRPICRSHSLSSQIIQLVISDLGHWKCLWHWGHCRVLLVKLIIEQNLISLLIPSIILLPLFKHSLAMCRKGPPKKQQHRKQTSRCRTQPRQGCFAQFHFFCAFTQSGGKKSLQHIMKGIKRTLLSQTITEIHSRRMGVEAGCHLFCYFHFQRGLCGNFPAISGGQGVEIVSVDFQKNWSGFMPSFTRDPFQRKCQRITKNGCLCEWVHNSSNIFQIMTHKITPVIRDLSRYVELDVEISDQVRPNLVYVFTLKRYFGVYLPFNQNIAGLKCKCRIFLKFKPKNSCTDEYDWRQR